MASIRPQRSFFVLSALAAFVFTTSHCHGAAEESASIPSADAIAQMLAKEPISRATWPTWRDRHLEWMYDRTNKTKKFGEQLEAFLRQEARAHQETLPDYLAQDAVAWDVYGDSLLGEKQPASIDKNFAEAEAAYRRSIALDAKFASPHGGLAATLMARSLQAEKPKSGSRGNSLLTEAEREIGLYVKLDSRSRPAFLRGLLAMARHDLPQAEIWFRKAMDERPASENAAVWCAQAVVGQTQRGGKFAQATEPLVKRFPEEGTLRVLHGLALARDGEYQAASEQFGRARQLKTKPEQILGPGLVASVDRMGKLATPAFRKGIEALEAQQYAAAERHLRQAIRETGENEIYARALAHSLLGQNVAGLRRHAASEIGGLCRRFPQDGELQALRAVALAQENRPGEAMAALRQARNLGANPAQIIGPNNVAKIEQLARPSLLVRFLWAAACFAAAYGAIMALMALAGVVLSLFTRGGAPPADGGLVAGRDPYGSQSGLKTLYLLALAVSLILFYVAIPFVVAGLLGATAAMLYGIFMLGRIPVKLVALIVIVGISMVWAVLKSIFARPGTGSFGLTKSESDCPRFHAAVREVADKVETRSVDEVYLGPGSEIGVRQEGRGPFGVFGVKRRVLTVGMANVRYLSVGELKAILAHEYAHFSHRDTFYSRFVHQVTLSVDQALRGMAGAAGKLNYVNPFFWFFVLYYRAYSLLAAGFSRSQEYLADRVAADLYGKDVFLSGLTKVATNGTLFEATVYQNVQKLLSEGKAFTNVYEAFSSYRDEQLTDQERREMYEKFIDQKGSVFASHPTVRERMAAVASFPNAQRPENDPALSLFDQPEELEKELSDYLTGYVHAVQQLQAAPREA